MMDFLDTTWVDQFIQHQKERAMSIEAMKQALEALDELNAQAGFFPDELHLEHPTIIKSEKAITSLRQAIATEESSATQEPVKHFYFRYERFGYWSKCDERTYNETPELYRLSLYTHPQPKATQEPVECKPDRSGKYLTIVYRDVDIGDEVLALTRHEKSCAMSWSNALWDVAYLKSITHPQTKAEQEPKREPLTAEQIGEIAIKSQDGISPHDDTLRFARAIEAAHGIKGEA